MEVKESETITGKVKIITTCSKTGRFLRETEFTANLIMLGTNTGKSLILQRITGINTYSLNVNYGDIGTGSATPTNSDTQLTTPTTRVALSNTGITSNVASLFFFFSDTVLANGTYTEFGSFIDGSSTLSTGQIFNHVLFPIAYVKTSGEDSTIQINVTIN